MNKQGKLVGGVYRGGIEWTHRYLPDGTSIQGVTTNPVKGCQHGCRWKIAGKIAVCYAEDTANGIASAAYPQGFEHHYWEPEEVTKWHNLQPGTRAFSDSMSDAMGHWVPDDQIDIMIAEMERVRWVNFQLLTKNPRRYLTKTFPKNVWLGASSPPDFMNGKELTEKMRDAMMAETLGVFSQITGNVRFMSAEPLTIDVARHMRNFHVPVVDWMIIGAASIGPQKVAPNEGLVRDLVYYCDQHQIPVFFKGNMNSLEWAVDHWRESFPSDLVDWSVKP